MSNNYENPFSALKGLFHEPNRLAIMSALCSTSEGLSFRELKERCALTDGNLSRHLKVLEEGGLVVIRKRFVGAKPLTTVLMTDTGRERFIDYLRSLEEVLKTAAESLQTREEGPELPLAILKAFQG